MRFFWILPFLSVLAASGVHAADSGAERQARAIVQQWIENGANVKSLEIDFVQERKLKALRQPLTKPGKIWFQRPDSFHWQIGEPPAIIAVRKSGGDLQVADTKEKKIRVWSVEEITTELADGKGHGFAMAGSGFPASLELFEQQFEINTARETKEAGVWDVNLDLRDRKAGIFVKEIIFTIQPADGSLRKFEIFMRDGSIMTTRVVSAKKNAVIPVGAFQLDATGYELEKK